MFGILSSPYSLHLPRDFKGMGEKTGAEAASAGETQKGSY
jgi:hypothetical protein